MSLDKHTEVHFECDCAPRFEFDLPELATDCVDLAMLPLPAMSVGSFFFSFLYLDSLFPPRHYYFYCISCDVYYGIVG